MQTTHDGITRSAHYYWFYATGNLRLITNYKYVCDVISINSISAICWKQNVVRPVKSCDVVRSIRIPYKICVFGLWLGWLLIAQMRNSSTLININSFCRLFRLFFVVASPNTSANRRQNHTASVCRICVGTRFVSYDSEHFQSFETRTVYLIRILLWQTRASRIGLEHVLWTPNADAWLRNLIWCIARFW